MIENPTSHLWYRRISQAAIATSLGIGILYTLPKFTDITLDPELLVTDIAALFALLTFLVSAAALIWLSRRDSHHILLAGLSYGLLLITTSVLIFSTKQADSPLIGLWLPTVIFSGIFGAYSLLIAAILPLVYLSWLCIFEGPTLPSMLALLLAGELPPILSYFIFSRSVAKKEDNTYQQLVSEFSAVSNKAEVLINAITNGVMALNNQGVIELINPAAQRIIGWNSHDALNLDYKSVLKLADEKSNELTPTTDPIAKALSTNEEVRTEDVHLITNSDKNILVSLVVSPVGQPGSGVIVVFRDITKEKAEERGQAEFISTASHEMRTPVASIEGYLGLALNPATAQIDAKARDYIMKAHEVAQHLGRLFQDLLDVTKADDGRLSNNPKVVEVVSFVQDIVESLRPKAEAKGLVLLYKPAPEENIEDKSNRRLNPVFYANIDNDHLREIVSNLVENAIKYTLHGSVSIDVDGNDKHINITVQDTGIGIPPEDLPHLFQKFYRVDNSDTREIGGTGLGLYLSRRLAEAVGGRLSAESKHKEGSTFTLEIPRISHPEAMQLIEAASNNTPEATPLPIVSAAVASAPLEPPVPTEAPAPAAEGVFASPSSATVAAQLSVPPAPAAATPTASTPPRSPSLAMIERNPQQYLTRPTTIPITYEDQNQP